MYLNRIREITARVAAAIVKEAVKEDIAEGYRDTDIKELRRLVQDDVRLSSYAISYFMKERVVLNAVCH